MSNNVNYLDSSKPQLGLTGLELSYNGNLLNCSGKRENLNATYSKSFDITTPGYLLIAVGEIDSSSSKNIIKVKLK